MGGVLVKLLCGFLILRNILCANGAYVYTKLVYDNTARQMTQIMADVGKLDGYEPGTTPVAFVGSFTDSQLAYHDPAFSRYEEGDLHQVNSAVTYDGTIKWWFQHVMGSNAAVIADSGTLIALGETRLCRLCRFTRQTGTAPWWTALPLSNCLTERKAKL
ncbi:hypothetical protein NIA69_21620 [Gemmiger formicilis]|nr:hypothetical protein [Gemmiger formicilis]